MSIEVHYDPTSETLYGRIIGIPTADELLSSFQRIKTAGGIPLDADVVWDLRALDFTSLTIELLRDIVKRRKMLNSHRTDCAAAYVVIGPQEERMIRLMIALSVGVQRQEAIFRRMDDAHAWLRGARDGRANPGLSP